MDFDTAVALISALIRQQIESKADTKFEEDLAQPIAIIAETFVRDVHSVAASLQTIAYVMHKQAVSDGVLDI